MLCICLRNILPVLFPPSSKNRRNIWNVNVILFSFDLLQKKKRGGGHCCFIIYLYFPSWVVKCLNVTNSSTVNLLAFVIRTRSNENRLAVLNFPGLCPHAIRKLKAVMSNVPYANNAKHMPLSAARQTRPYYSCLCRGLPSLLLSVLGQTVQQVF